MTTDTAAIRVKPYIASIDNHSTCKSCRQPIVWCLTTKNKRIPMDQNGEPHWATCPQADAHRKGRRP